MNTINKCKRMICLVLCFFLIMGTTIQASSKTTARISCKSLVIKVGMKKQISIIGVSKKKKIKWSSSNDKVATVSSKGVIKAKKAGNVRIIGLLSKKKRFTCSVKIISRLLVTQIVANGRLYNLRQQTKDIVRNMCKSGLYIWNCSNPVAVSELVGGKKGNTVYYETMIDPVKLTRTTRDPKSGKEVNIPNGSMIRVLFGEVRKLTGDSIAFSDIPCLENNLGAKVLWVDNNKEYAKMMLYPNLNVGESSFSKQNGIELFSGACFSGYTTNVYSTRKVIIFRDGKEINVAPYLAKAELVYDEKDKHDDVFLLCKTISKNLGLGITISDFIDYSKGTDDEAVFFTSGERFVEEYSKSHGKEMFIKTFAFVMAINDLLMEYSNGEINDFGTYEIQKDSKKKDGIQAAGLTLFTKKDYGDSLKSVL